MDVQKFTTEYQDRQQELIRQRDRARAAAQDAFNLVDTKAVKVRTEARTAANQVYEDAITEAHTVYDAAFAVAEEEFTKGQTALVEELAGDGSDAGKLLGWMVQTGWYRRFPGHCTEIIEAMPMTFDQFKVFGTDKGWCDDYNKFLQEALLAGAVPGVTTKEGAAYAVEAVITKLDLYSEQKQLLASAFEKLTALIPDSEAADAPVDATGEKSEA